LPIIIRFYDDFLLDCGLLFGPLCTARSLYKVDVAYGNVTVIIIGHTRFGTLVILGLQ